MLFSQIVRRSPQWKRAVAEAEKLVSYSGSYLSLQSSLSDEEANLALSVRKLLGTKHPLLQTANKVLRDLFYNGNNSIQTRGLVVLLVSQAANDLKRSLSGSQPSTSAGTDCSEKILTKQRHLAEIVEIVYTANLLHRGVLDVAQMTSGNVEKLKLGNKLAVLGGDFLLANASVALANLCAPQVTSSVAQGIADMSEAEFLSLKHPDRALPQDLWDRTIYLQSGSLLAHSCKSAILLADLDDQSLLDNSFTIGRRVALIYALSEILTTNGSVNNKRETPEIDMSRQETFDWLENQGKLAIESINSSFPSSSGAVRSLKQIIRALSDRKCLV